MPTYDYVCQDCGHSFEHFQSMTSDLLKTCPECEKDALKRLIGAGSALIFKGSGFYCTDYKDKGKKKDEKPSEKQLDAKVDKAKQAAKDTKPAASSSSSGGGDS